MRIVLANNLTELTECWVGSVIWAHPPDNGTLSINDRDDVRFSATPDDVLRVEPLVSILVPVIRSEIGRGIDV